MSIAPSHGGSGFEQYNTFNGNLTASIPLHHIGGRGEAGFDLVWNLQPNWLANHPQPGSSFVQIDPYPSNNIAGAGNDYGLGGPGFVYSRTGFTWRSCGGYFIASSVTSVIYVTATGAQVTLTDTNTNGAAEPVPNPTCGGYQPASWDVGRGTSFRSTDGSQIQFNASSNVQEQNIGNGGYGAGKLNGTLVFPNGVSYQIANSYVKSIVDRNGNKITLTYADFNNLQHAVDWSFNVPLLTAVTDSLGRQTTISYSDSSCGGCLSITYPGAAVNGTATTHVVKVITATLGASTLRSDSSLKSIPTLFPNSGQTSESNYTPTVASAIELPDGSEYTFQYNSYGEIAHVVLPTGGAIEYDYGDGADGSNDGYQSNSSTGGVMIYRRLQTRREYATGYNNGVTSKTTHSVSYQGTGNTGPIVETTTVFDPSGNVMSEVAHTMQGSPLDALNLNATGCNNWNEGLETQTQYGSPVAVTVMNTPFSQSGCMSNPQIQTRSVTLNDTGQQSSTVFAYDSYGNVNDQKDYDWGVNPATGSWLRRTTTTYLSTANAAYASVNLVRLPYVQAVMNASGNAVAQTDWRYDEETPQPTPGISTSTYTPPATAQRGNLTSVYQTLETSSGNVSNQYRYDTAGNVVSAYDANNNLTSFDFNYDTSNQYAFATKITMPTVNTVTHILYPAYDYGAGKISSSKDFNGNKTSFTYNDGFDRITGVTYPNSQTATAAYTSGYPMTVTWSQDQKNVNDLALKAVTTYDGLGRSVETDQYESASQYIASKTDYDAAGRVWHTYNPSRPSDGLNFTTTYLYDSLGRNKSIQTADSQTTTTTYSGNVTTVTDPADRARQYTNDALGRLSGVVEDPNGNLKYATVYGYDAIGNLTCVNQGHLGASGVCDTTQPYARSFSYDGLSHLLSASNPESGTVSYTYYPTGTIHTRTDSRGIAATNSYDALNRITGTSYSDATSTVSYSYDTGSNGIGQLTSVNNGSSSTSFTGFDAMGRVTASQQTTGNQTYTFSNYTYNLAGALIKETYPSNRVVTTTYDGANRVLGVSGLLAGATTNYLSTLTYWPHGAINSYNRGNNLGYTAIYNSRLQPVQTYEALNGNSTQEMAATCLNWGTQSSNACGGFFQTSGDNGTLLGKVDYAGAPATFSSLPSYSHTYAYDALNRLTSDTDSGGASRTFAYDQWGNMATTAGAISGLTPPSVTGFNANNRLTSSSFNYDNAGNMILQGTLTIMYDANNRQTSTSDSVSHVQTNYSYDGLGSRVMKQVTGGPTTVYVYDAFGQMAAEYTNASSLAPCVICYLSYDHLGSVRMVTDQTGSNIIAMHDYFPFGEEIPGGSTYGRSAQQYGGTDGVSQRFTGQQRDSENTPALDFFGARYMSPVLGRFASPDPGNAGADLTNPQSWNGYSYALNNPLIFVDPTGRDCIVFDDGSKGLDPDNPQGGCGSVDEDGNDSQPEQAGVDATFDLIPTVSALGYPGSSYSGQASQSSNSGPNVTAAPAKNVAPPTWRQRANCASDFGNKYSLAAGFSALTGVSADNPVVSTLLGNDASTLSNIATGRDPLGSTISEVFSNPTSTNLATHAVVWAGAIPTGGAATAELGVNGAGTYFVKTFTTPTVAGTVVGKVAGAVLGKAVAAKAVYDFATYGIGLATCW